MLQIDQMRRQITTIKDGSDAARRQAIHSLREQEPQEWDAIPSNVLGQLVDSLRLALECTPKSPVVNKDIAVIITRLGPHAKAAVPHLMNLIQDGVPTCIRDAAILALGRIGSDAKEAVNALLAISGTATTTSICSVRALGEIGCADSRVRATLLELWQCPTHTLGGFLHIAVALARLKIKAENLISFLTSNLTKGQDEACRKTAAEALGYCDKNELDVVPSLLLAALADKNEDVQKVAQGALAQLMLTNEKAIQLCAAQLDKSVYAEAALRKAGASAVPALIVVLKKDDLGIRIKAANIVASMGELAIDAVPALKLALRDRSANMRMAAAKGLWCITKTPDESVAVLTKLLVSEDAEQFEDDEARRRYLQTVIEALWRIGPPAAAAIPSLLAKAKDKNRLVGQSATYALSKIAGK